MQTLQPAARPNKPWGVAEFAAHMGHSTRHVRRLITSGQIKGIRFGRRLLIPAAEAERISANGVER